MLSRGVFCPKDRRQAEGLVQLHREMEVGYCRFITINTDTNENRSGIAAQGRRAAAAVERRFVEMCERAGFVQPAKLGKQINILFQGALLLSQVYGDSSSFVSATSAVTALLETAPVAEQHRSGRKSGHAWAYPAARDWRM